MSNHEKKRRHINIPVFIPHLGCPNTCVFCDQRNISGRDRPVEVQDVGSIIEEWVSTASANDEIELAFFGGSFTGIPRDEMIAYLEAAHDYVKKGVISGIRISTRPDYIDDEILDILKDHGVKVIELGVQSMMDTVLRLSRRGHTVQDVVHASELIKKRGFTLGIQIMPGLPSDTIDTSLKTAEMVIALKPEIVRIYPAVVLKGTELETLYKAGLFKPLTIEEAVTWCSIMVPLFRRAGILIVRLGLHYSEVLADSVVAGPFHPAFGEMVESGILLDRISRIIEDKRLDCEGIAIQTWKGALSKTLGHKRANITALKERYGYKHIVVKESDCLPGEIRVLKYDRGELS